MLKHHIGATRLLEIVSWTANTPTSPRLSLRVAIAALGRCNCFVELHGLAGCLISTPSTASRVMSGTLRRVAPSSSRNCMPEQRQPDADRPGYQANREKARGHNRSYSMSPTIAECLEHARQCEWYAARTNDEQDRKFLLRKAKEWTKLAIKKELEIRASARAAA